LPQHVSEKTLALFQTEVNTLRLIRHPNIIELYGVCVDRGADPKNLAKREPFFCLVMQYAPNGSLYDLIHNPGDNSITLDLPLIVKILKQIANALVYLHKRKPPFIHRDLKPDNIVFDAKYDIKLIDFGLAKDPSDLSYPHGKGTIRWMAPEQFNANPTTSSEVYSFGIIIWELLSRQLPYPDVDNVLQYGLARYKSNRDYRFVFPQNSPPQLQLLAERCLKFDPVARPSMDTILHDLEEIFPNPIN